MHCLFAATSGVPVRITDQPDDGIWQYVVDGVGIVAAIGTLFALYYLYRSNQAAHRSATAAQEQASGAWRPILTAETAVITWFPRGVEQEGVSPGAGGTADERCSVDVTLKNVGRGPAFGVSFELRRNAAPDRYLEQVSADKAARRDGPSVPILGEGDTWEPEVRGHLGPTDMVYLLGIYYHDLQEKAYSTDVTLDRLSIDTSIRDRATKWPLSVSSVKVRAGKEASAAPRGNLRVLATHPPAGEGGDGFRIGDAVRD